MKGAQTNLAGPAIVIVILVLAALGTGLTWRQYASEHPAAVRAVLLDAGTAGAEFAPEKAPLIRRGARAIISVNGVRSTGYVTDVAVSGKPAQFRLRLLQPFTGAAAGTPCQVTVDLSIPPELLKESGPPH